MTLAPSSSSRSDSFHETIADDSSRDECKDVTQYSLPLGQIDDFQVSNDDESIEVFNKLNNGTSQNTIIGSAGSKIGDDYSIIIEGQKVNVNITNLVNPQDVATEDSKEKNESHRVQKSVPQIQKFELRLRYVYLPSTALFILVLLAISLTAFWNNIFPKSFEFQPINPKTDYFIANHAVYNRSNWGALDSDEELSELPLPSSLVIISHTGTEPCTDFAQCANINQHIQYEHIRKRFHDINYNFLIGGEGGIYVGRGWQHENIIRVRSVAIAFIGDFIKGYATDEAINASLALIGEGVKQGKISEHYKLIGENQTSAKRFYSPGYHLVAVIKTFEHYFSGTML